MASTLRDPAEAPPLPTVPTVEAWRAMAPAERERLQVEINTALTASARLMSEGQPHKKTKSRAIDALGLHFKTIGRVVYLAEELSVLYPGEKPFAPDILAVLDVEQPEDDERLAWVVADEVKGIDLVIEVLHKGDRHKDLVENVERYARLGIPEYFVYDRLRQQIHGYRLPVPVAQWSGASRYQRIVPQLGHYRSNVLGIDLAIIGDNLRFLAGQAALPVSADLIDRLHGIVESLEVKAEQAEAQAEHAQAQAEHAQARAVLTVLRVRGIAVPGAARERILAQKDAELLDRWLEKAVVAASLDEVIEES